MKILLLQPPTGERFIKKGSLVPPMGLPYLAAVLEKRNIDLQCLDADSLNLTLDEIIAKIKIFQPDVLGISVNTPSVNNAVYIAKRIKKEIAATTIAGGPHATVLPEELLNKGFDFVVRGEAEETILEFIDLLENKKKREEIAGLCFKKDGAIKCNPERKLIANLDTLPFPAWHFFPINIYKSDFKKTNLTLPILTSRGCPGQCVFCYKSIFGNCLRVRTPKNVIQEIKYLKTRYGIDGFDILDDSFTAIPRRAIEICKLMVGEKINLPWGLPSGIRVDTVSKELFKVLKEAGCYRIGFGVESGNDYILKTIKKNITKDQVRKAVKMAKAYSFRVECFFIIGNLEETEDTINETIDFAKELDPDIAQFGIATPYPGTKMYNILINENRLISTKWEDYDSFSGKQIFVHKNLSANLLRKKFREAYRRFYFRPSYLMKKLKLLQDKKERKKLIHSFFNLLSLAK